MKLTCLNRKLVMKAQLDQWTRQTFLLLILEVDSEADSYDVFEKVAHEVHESLTIY